MREDRVFKELLSALDRNEKEIDEKKAKTLASNYLQKSQEHRSRKATGNIVQSVDTTKQSVPKLSLLKEIKYQRHNTSASSIVDFTNTLRSPTSPRLQLSESNLKSSKKSGQKNKRVKKSKHVSHHDPHPQSHSDYLTSTGNAPRRSICTSSSHNSTISNEDRSTTSITEPNEGNAHIYYGYMHNLPKRKIKSKLSQNYEVINNNPLKYNSKEESTKTKKSTSHIEKKISKNTKKVRKIQKKKEYITKFEQKRINALEKEYPKLAAPVKSTIQHNNRLESPLLDSNSFFESNEYSVVSDTLSDFTPLTGQESVSEPTLWINTKRIRTYISRNSSPVEDDLSSRIESPQTPPSPPTNNYHQYLIKKRRTQRSQTWSGNMPRPRLSSISEDQTPILKQKSPLSSTPPSQVSTPNSSQSTSITNGSSPSTKSEVRRNSAIHLNQQTSPSKDDGSDIDSLHKSPYFVSKWSNLHNYSRGRSHSVHSEPMRIIEDDAHSDDLSSIHREHLDQPSPLHTSSSHKSEQSPKGNSSQDLQSPILEELNIVQFENTNDFDPRANCIDEDHEYPNIVPILPEMPLDALEIHWSEISRVPTSSFSVKPTIDVNFEIHQYPNRLSMTNRFSRRLSDPPIFYRSASFKVSDEIKHRSRSSSLTSRTFMTTNTPSLECSDISSFQQLPDKVIGKILSFVPYSQRFKLSIVCSKLNRSVNTDQNLWKEIQLDKLPENVDGQSKLLSIIFHRFGKYVHILRGDRDISPCIEILAEKGTELRELDLYISLDSVSLYPNNELLKHFKLLLTQNHHLKILRLKQDRCLIGHETIVDLVTSCHTLRELHLIIRPFDEIRPYNQSSDDSLSSDSEINEINEINDGDSPISLETIRTIAVKSFKLHILRLVDCPIDDDTISFITKNLRVLNTLSVTICHLKGSSIDPILYFKQPHIQILRLELPTPIDYYNVLISLQTRTHQYIQGLTLNQAIDDEFTSLNNGIYNYSSKSSIGNPIQSNHSSNSPASEDKEPVSIVGALISQIIKTFPQLERLTITSPYMYLTETDLETIDKYYQGVELNLLNINEEEPTPARKKWQRKKRVYPKRNVTPPIMQRPEWKR